jgi:hypothetical protein
MVLYEDKKWLCRLIRTAFTIDDDTGICEKMFKDRPYIGPDEVDSDPVSSDDSFDIREGSELGIRRRSNTAARLDMMEKQKKTSSETKTVKVNPNPVEKSDFTFERDTSYRDRDKKDKKKGKKPSEVGTSASASANEPVAGPSSSNGAAGGFSLKELIESVPHPDDVPFSEYIRFDASSQPGTPSKTMAIFITFLPPAQQAYPIIVNVTLNGKVRDLVGLILWQVSQKYPDIKLDPVHFYNLQIADEDGEWIPDFPPLEQVEPISKFSFSHLALVKCNQIELANPSLGKVNLSFLLPNGIKFNLVVDNIDMTVGELVTLALNKSGWSTHVIPPGCIELGYHLEKLGDPNIVFLDPTIPFMQTKCKDFCLVRDGSKSFQSAIAKADQRSGSKANIEVGRSDLYRVMVSTGRFNKVKNALCVIWSGDRMDLEFQHKTKSYPLSWIGGVKFDATKNKVVLTLKQNPFSGAMGSASAAIANQYLTTTNQLTFTTAEPRIAQELYQHLNQILTSK